jgi:hypothetical protein
VWLPSCDGCLQVAAGQAAALPAMHLLAVFDGHSTASVSAMAAQQLPGLIQQLLAHEAAAGAGGLGDAAMHHVLTQACEQLDALVPALDNSGSTATLALLTADRIHLAWVGDSRALLLGRHGTVLAATDEHRATREDEQVRWCVVSWCRHTQKLLAAVAGRGERACAGNSAVLLADVCCRRLRHCPPPITHTHAHAHTHTHTPHAGAHRGGRRRCVQQWRAARDGHAAVHALHR